MTEEESIISYNILTYFMFSYLHKLELDRFFEGHQQNKLLFLLHLGYCVFDLLHSHCLHDHCFYFPYHSTLQIYSDLDLTSHPVTNLFSRRHRISSYGNDYLPYKRHVEMISTYFVSWIRYLLTYTKLSNGNQNKIH